MTVSSHIADWLQTAIIVIDGHGRIRQINQAGEELLEKSYRQLRGKRIHQVLDLRSLALPSGSDLRNLDKAYHRQQLLVALHSGKTIAGDLVISRIKDDSSTESRSNLLLEWQNQHRGHQIEEEGRRGSQLQASEHLLKSLAHEIRNPLSGLKGATQLLSSELKGGELKPVTDIIEREVDRLSKLVDSMLLSGKPASLVEVNLHEVLEEAIKFCQLEGHEEIVWVRDYDPSIPELWLAPEQIYQALLNLIRNACEAIEFKGQITLRTRVLSRHTIGSKQFRLVARLDVIDDGPGVKDEIKGQIFFPTISGKRSSGLGLGLALGLIQRHQGTIDFSSKPGETRFSVYLPELPQPAPETRL